MSEFAIGVIAGAAGTVSLLFIAVIVAAIRKMK